MKSIIDISVKIDKLIPVWEGDPRPEFVENINACEPGTTQTTTVKMNVHTGTHIDAPRHFFQDGNIAPDINLDRLVGACNVVEVKPSSPLISKQELIAAGVKAGQKRVLLKTENSKLWAAKGNRFTFDYVSLGPDASEYLLECGVDLIGIDYLSIAPFDNVWTVHQRLLSSNVIILEGLNLLNVPAGEYELICLPLKLDSKDGLPVRAILR